MRPKPWLFGVCGAPKYTKTIGFLLEMGLRPNHGRTVRRQLAAKTTVLSKESKQEPDNGDIHGGAGDSPQAFSIKLSELTELTETTKICRTRCITRMIRLDQVD